MDINNADERHDYMAEQLRMSVAYQIRLIRVQRSLSQDQLAEIAGCSPMNIAGYEDWNSPIPTLGELKKIAKALDIALLVRFVDWQGVTQSLIPSREGENPPETP